MILQVDDALMMVNTSTGLGGASQVPTKLASTGSLDNSTVHTIYMGWMANVNTNTTSGLPFPLSYMYFSHLNIADFREA